MSDLSPLTRDKLLVALSVETIVTEINTAMRARKASITIDFRKALPRILIQMPGVEQHMWFEVNPRTKLCLAYHPKNPDLRAVTDDITRRLMKHDAWINVGVRKYKDGKRACKLMVAFRDSDRIVITLLSAQSKTTKTQDHFLVPEILQ